MEEYYNRNTFAEKFKTAKKMKRSILALVLILSASLTDAKVQNVCDEVFLQVSITDPTEEQLPIKRSPVAIPSVSLENHTLLFATPCDGCALRLINEDGDVEYAAVVPMNTTTLVFPSYLSGEYQLQIIRGRFCFWGYIDL